MIRRISAGICFAVFGGGVAFFFPEGVSTSYNITVTKRLVEAGVILGIKIHDHIIVSKNGYMGTKEQGLI